MSTEEMITHIHDDVITEKLKIIRNRMVFSQFPTTIVYCMSSLNNKIITHGFTHMGSTFEETLESMKIMLDFETLNRTVRSLGNDLKENIMGYNLLIPLINSECSILLDFFYIKDNQSKISCHEINMNCEADSGVYSYDDFIENNRDLADKINFATVNIFDNKEETKNNIQKS